MAWNEPGKGNDNKGQNNDPWGNSNKPKGGDQGPPDLDEVFNKISQKISGFGKKGGGSSHGSKGSSGGAFVGIGFILAIAIGVWGFSGFYTIGEAERGVVLRLGKFDRIVEPGLNWRPRFVDQVTPINVQAIRTLRASGLMLTKDENVVTVEMGVQYKITDPKKFLYQVTNAVDSLGQATDSALRAVIGDSLMDSILTSGRQAIRQETENTLNSIIEKYDMGITVVDVNFQSSRPPEAVKDAFDDAIAAREDEERFIREAEAHKNEILPKAQGKAESVKKAAQGYSERVTNEALGQVAQFEKLLPEYQSAKQVTRDRLYLDTMEKIYTQSSKVLIDSESSGNMMYLPLDQLMKQSPRASVTTSEQSAPNYDVIKIQKSTTEQGPVTINGRTSSRQGRL